MAGGIAEADLARELRDLVGPAGWLDPADAVGMTVDFRGLFSGEPVAVVRPRTVDEVRAVVRACSAAGVAIVTQGGNTSLSGGSVPTDDRPSVLVSTARMDQIISVEPARYTITAEAGCTIEQVQRAAEKVGRQLGMDWGARGTATVGGAVSTNAGGLNVLRYGPARDSVVGLEAVLADGEVFDGLRALRKDNSGYDLKHLFIGGEGSLGIITRVVLKLYPRHNHQRTFFAALAELEDVHELYDRACALDHAGLTAFELVPEAGLAGTIKSFGVARPIATHSDWYLLGRFSGTSPVDDAAEAFLSDATNAGLLLDAVMAGTTAQEQNLWILREELPPETLFDAKGAKFDVAVPIDRVAEYQRAVEALIQDLCGGGAVVYSFGHLGDGNLHLYVISSLERGSRMEPGLIDEIQGSVDRLTWDMGGTVSAEHGVGQELLERVAGQKSAVELEMMRRVKAALDPNDLFNPGRGAHCVPVADAGEVER
ncbi:MAG TPA: hydroxyacid dehydrogenase [Acidimicrobiaceae bacterium]|nr:hydroxyacid dehydrogenase [Acidimicrobiaceae bacterium]|tara:strand:+ start:285 stop:1736 length:1452 start_codon:yes stop_codon:yes gene_type:complete